VNETPFETEQRVIDQAREHQRRKQAQQRGGSMFAILAAILGGVGYVLSGTQAHTSAWDSPQALLIAAVGCLALYLLGFPGRPPKP
jgi:glycine cleavage system pyridoxal-binding protein P